MSEATENPQELPADVQELVTRLFTWAREGNLDLIEYVKRGVNVELKNQEGNSFLMLAAYNGHPELVKALIEQGADVNTLNAGGQAPLAGVLFKREDEVLDVLLAAGADPLAGHPNAIDSARMFGREDVLERLTKAAEQE